MKHRPSHQTGDCEVIRRDGTLCATRATLVMTREDQSRLPMCTRHSNQLRETMASHPLAFNPVTWQLVTK